MKKSNVLSISVIMLATSFSGFLQDSSDSAKTKLLLKYNLLFARNRVIENRSL